MLKAKILTSSALALVMMAGAAQAAMVTLSNLQVQWVDTTGGVNVTPTPTAAAGTSSISWGTTTGPQSGYDFAVESPAPGPFVVPPSTGAFELGVFTHRNRPIGAGTSITAAQLSYSMDVMIDAGPIQTVTFLFDFAHNETDNDANPCANGGANNAGVNAGGCADIVTVSNNSASGVFLIGGVEFTVSALGFGLPTQDEFITAEDSTTSITLFGQITAREDNVVPEPASLALLGIGAFGLAALRRKKVH